MSCSFMTHHRWCGVEGKMAIAAGLCPRGRGHKGACVRAHWQEEEEVGAGLSSRQ